VNQIVRNPFRLTHDYDTIVTYLLSMNLNNGMFLWNGLERWNRLELRDTHVHQAANNGFQAGIWWNNQLVGCIGFHSIDWSNRKISIGYWLAQGFQGDGIMTNARKALVDIAFDHYGLNRVEIRAATDNHKSRTIPERLGFDNEGCIREAEWLYDHFVDHIVYGMLAAQWRPKSFKELVAHTVPMTP
jgi:RimJ/RimL family protein N-acetyltransferase